MMKVSGRAAMVLVVFCGLAGRAFQHEPHGGGEPGGWSEMTASMEKMHAAMAAAKSSGDSDADFVRLMLPHHLAAIEMSRSELLHGKDPQMRRLAQEIITDQQSEIELMQLWLKQHPRGGRP